MRFSATLLFITIVYLLAFTAHALYLKKTVYGDGVFYFSWLRSVVVDRDIDFSNEYAYFGVTQPKTPTGALGNKYTVGPAILWAPLYIWTHTVVGDDGYGLPYQLAVGYTSVVFTLFGLLLLYRLLKQRFSKWSSLFAVAGLAGATNLLFYGSLDPVNSHALSFFAATLFLTFITQARRNWLLIGASLGLLALFRLQDVLYTLLLSTHLRGVRAHLGGVRKTLPLVLLGFSGVFGWQLLAWQTLYGGILTNPYFLSGEGFNFFHPQVLGILFSPTNGLFLWTPIAAIGFFGLIWKKYWSYLAIFLIQLMIIASWSTWWQGASYSGRMFVSTLPLFAFGLAEIFSWLQKRVLLRHSIAILLVLPLTVLNILSIIRFLLSI